MGRAASSRKEPLVLLWFRAEQLETINWAGNPHKPADVGADGLRLLVSAATALFAVYFLKAGAIGAFLAIALGFVVYGGLNLFTLLKIRAPVSPDR
jgi:Phytochrome region